MTLGLLWLCVAIAFVVACILTNPFAWAILGALGVTVLFIDLHTTGGKR